MGVELPLHVVVTILECCVTFSGVKLSIRSFVLFLEKEGGGGGGGGVRKKHVTVRSTL